MPRPMDESQVTVKKKIAVLILAAGRSSRMNAFKPLLPLGGRTMIEALIHTYRSAGIWDILAVLGHRAAEVRTVLARHDVAWIVNERYERGMFSSIQEGVRNLSPDNEAFFLQPADIPLIRPETLKSLLAARREESAVVCYPCHEGRRGHPPLLAASLIPAILAFDDPGGMRALLLRYRQYALNVACDDPGILMNLNTPEDYEQMVTHVAETENL